VLATSPDLKIVPIQVTGTRDAMPPGRIWPKRLGALPVSKRHRITVSFGEPITPTGDTGELIDSVQKFFENATNGSGPYRSPYGRRAQKTADR
jgi:1-acyl-sn-glycerol-3-phosphate acyltransferase